jgi:thymidylate synthase
MQVFEGASANRVWIKAVDFFKSQARARQSSRVGDTYEVIPAALEITNPQDRWVFSREPALSVAFALVEVIGIVNARRDSHYLNYFNPTLPRYAGKGPTFHGAYGYRLRSNFQFDQLKRAVDVLVSSPSSRQVVLQIWDAQLDMPHSDGRPRAEDIPCNVCSMLKVRNGKLCWTQVMRSNDLFRGSPYNFVQFTTLQEIISGWLDLALGPYVHVSDSLHIYVRDADKAFAYSQQSDSRNTDSLRLPYEQSQHCWGELNRCVDELSQPTTVRDIEGIAVSGNLPTAYLNMLKIIAADAAIRVGAPDLAVELGSKCQNPVLKLCWERWYTRTQRKTLRSAST